MLAIVEGSLQALSAARTDTDVTRVLGDAGSRLGFRSAYLIEYAGKLSAMQHVLDTDAARRGWWRNFFASDLRPSAEDVRHTLEGQPIRRLDASRFRPGSDRLRAECEANDVIDVVAVPILHEDAVVGVAGFCGNPKLGPQQETALQMIAYSAFAHIRATRTTAAPGGGKPISLTPREREVMLLSATGLTSVEIAAQLGMSARTVNQHVDNVADKLGTRNRAHTVAEIMRRGLL